jgi:uncharacterized protein YbjT (DUF2867 family)
MRAQVSDPQAAPVLVTGATGTLGQLVVPRLRAAGCTVRLLSRHDRAAGEGIEWRSGDLTTGEGIDAAVAGVQTIVHLAGSAKGDDEKARHLVAAASRAGVRHLVYISVVGADRVPIVSAVDRAMFGYFGAKLAAERIVSGSGLPWTTLRATQFQETLLKVAEGIAKLPVVPVPAGFQFQPVAAPEVAARLVELALGAPAGLVPDLAGPRTYQMADLIRGYLRAFHKRRLIVLVPTMGKAARAVRGGATLSAKRAVGRRTWEEYLAERASAPHENGAAVN